MMDNSAAESTKFESGSPNIFRISATPYGAEDKLTAHLSYLLNEIPEIGEAWLNHLLTQGGEEPDEFRGAGKHAEGNRESQPDFVIKGADVDVLCEHKLGADLEPRQLERYLEIARSRSAANNGRRVFLALVSGSPRVAATEVLSSPDFLRPKDSERSYFHWEELHELLIGRTERLAVHFREYLEDLGYRRIRSERWGSLFQDRSMNVDFCAHWDRAASHFKTGPHQASVIIKPTTSSSMLVKGLPGTIAMLYYKPAERSGSKQSAIKGPVLYGHVAIRPDSPDISRFAEPTPAFSSGNLDILGYPLPLHGGGGPSNPAVWCHEYVVPLEQVLSSDVDEMQNRLLEFATAVYTEATRKATAT